MVSAPLLLPRHFSRDRPCLAGMSLPNAHFTHALGEFPFPGVHDTRNANTHAPTIRQWNAYAYAILYARLPLGVTISLGQPEYKSFPFPPTTQYARAAHSFAGDTYSALGRSVRFTAVPRVGVRGQSRGTAWDVSVSPLFGPCRWRHSASPTIEYTRQAWSYRVSYSPAHLGRRGRDWRLTGWVCDRGLP